MPQRAPGTSDRRGGGPDTPDPDPPEATVVRIQKPLSQKCKPCNGNGGRNVQKLQQFKVRVHDQKTGRMVDKFDHKTVTVWETCRSCRGTGLA
ncbi:MAG TPA: hypothetical protein VFX70_07215 [Mycobacteriales bacterium]|nr:hypothetical protein [Mycobacteriales bacterium]